MRILPFQFSTESATLCVYDLGALKHRLDSEEDWWSWPVATQLQEANAGHVLFVDVGADGAHDGHIQFEPLAHFALEGWLNCPTGRLFVGSADEVTAEGKEPECAFGGLFVSVPVGAVHLQLARSMTGTLQLALLTNQKFTSNRYTRPLRLA
ncbi:DUF6386 family protein [Chitinimonas naiadis]